MLTLSHQTFSIMINMKAKAQVIFDIKSEKFQYLLRGHNKTKNVVDIDVINKRLNQIKKNNIYANVKMIGVALFIIAIFILISLKF
jgi:hypothetical protein